MMVIKDDAESKRCSNPDCQSILRKGNDDLDNLCSICRKKINLGQIKIPGCSPIETTIHVYRSRGKRIETFQRVRRNNQR